MTDLPSYPSDAAEREATAGPTEARSDYASWGRRVGAYLLYAVILFVPLVASAFAIGFALGGDDEDAALGAIGIAYVLTAVVPFLVILLILDYLWPLWDKKNQALHDKVVGSVVVRG